MHALLNILVLLDCHDICFQSLIILLLYLAFLPQNVLLH